MFKIGDKILCKNGYQTSVFDDYKIEVKSSKWYKISEIVEYEKHIVIKVSTLTGFLSGSWAISFYQGKDGNTYSPKFSDHFFTETEIRKRKLLKLKNES